MYADNMLCLDLCAVPKDIAKRVIGASVSELCCEASVVCCDKCVRGRERERVAV